MMDDKNGNKCCCTARLSICNLGMALGCVWGLTLFAIAMLSMYAGIGTPFVELFGTIYRGFEAALIGSFIGFAWGFVNGFITGMLIAMFYNLFSRICRCSYCKKNRECCR